MLLSDIFIRGQVSRAGQKTSTEIEHSFQNEQTDMILEQCVNDLENEETSIGGVTSFYFDRRESAAVLPSFIGGICTEGQSEVEERGQSSSNCNTLVRDRNNVREETRCSFQDIPESNPIATAYSKGSGEAPQEAESSSLISRISQMISVNQANCQVKQEPSDNSESWDNKKEKLDQISLLPASTQHEKPGDADQQMEEFFKEEEPDSLDEANCTRISESEDFYKQVTRSPRADFPISESDKMESYPRLVDQTLSIEGALKQPVEMHCKERPFKCPSCEKSFKTKSALECHKRLHTGEKPFLCKECGESFRQSSNLSSHLLVHSKNKPYKCTVCGRGFSQSSHLNTHMRTHTREKPYKCSECGKAFSQNVTLGKHMRVHTGERQFACEDCHYRFTKFISLHSHRSRVHGVTFSIPKSGGRGWPRRQ